MWLPRSLAQGSGLKRSATRHSPPRRGSCRFSRPSSLWPLIGLSRVWRAPEILAGARARPRATTLAGDHAAARLVGGQRLLVVGQPEVLRHQRVHRVLQALLGVQDAVHRELQVLAPALRATRRPALSPAARGDRAPPLASRLPHGRSAGGLFD